MIKTTLFFVVTMIVTFILSSCSPPVSISAASQPTNTETQKDSTASALTSATEPADAKESDASKYDRAVALYQAGRYYEASALFGEIPDYSDAKALQEDAHKKMILAPVLVDGKWGYIDNFDNMVIEPQYDDAKPFQNGAALVRTGADWKLADAYGAVVKDLKTSWASVGPFMDGLASFSQPDENGDIRYGCIDQAGKVVFQAFSSIPIYFIDGIALVAYGKEYYLSVQGDLYDKERIAESTRAPAGHTNDLYPSAIAFFLTGIAGACDPAGVEMYTDPKPVSFPELCGFIYPDGSFAITPKYKSAGSFIDGLAPVCDETGKWGFIDRFGSFAIPPVYEDALRFSQGLAAVKTNGKYGYIDRNGNMAIPPQFYGATIFREGLAGVKMADSAKDEGWGFIDDTGKAVIAPAYGAVEESGFMDGYCVVGSEVKNGDGDGMKYGVIDRTGAWKIKPKYESVPSCWPGGILADMSYTSLRGKNETVQYDTGLDNHGQITGSYHDMHNPELSENFVFSDGGFVESLAPCDIPDDSDSDRPASVWEMLEQGFLTSPDDLDYEMGLCVEGMCLFTENTLYGFKDAQGNTVIEAKYKRAGPFGACSGETIIAQ